MPAASRSIEVRESIEAKGSDRSDDDVDMEDADAHAEIDVAVGDDEMEVDAEGELDADQQPSRSDDTKNLVGLIETTSQYLCGYNEE